MSRILVHDELCFELRGPRVLLTFYPIIIINISVIIFLYFGLYVLSKKTPYRIWQYYICVYDHAAQYFNATRIFELMPKEFCFKSPLMTNYSTKLSLSICVCMLVYIHRYVSIQLINNFFRLKCPILRHLNLYPHQEACYLGLFTNNSDYKILSYQHSYILLLLLFFN